MNLDLLRLFEERETLRQDEAVAVYGALFAKEKHTPEFTADRCANSLQWGVRLGILAEMREGDRLSWRLLDRELMWETSPSGWARQIRGLPDAEQAELNRKRAASQKAAATRQRKAAEALAPRIQEAVDDLIAVRDDFICPDERRWREAIPNARLPCPLIEVRPMLMEAHYAMEPRRQRAWLQELRTTASIERFARHNLAWRPPAAPGTPRPEPVRTHVPDVAPMDDDDAAALEGL